MRFRKRPVNPNCPSCGCKWKRCAPDAPGSDTGNTVCAYCGTVQGRYSFTSIDEEARNAE